MIEVPTTVRVLVAALTIAGPAPIAFAQSKEPRPPHAPEAPTKEADAARADDDAPPAEDGAAPTAVEILRGPAVPKDSVRTLVSLDMAGRFQRVEGRPEIAALQLLALSPDDRAAATTVIEARSASMRDFLIDQIDAIKQSTDAAQAGDNATAQRMRRELYDLFDPEHPRDPLLEPLVGVLPAEQGRELRRLLDEYWQAWIEAELRNAPRSNADAVQARLAAELVQNEFRAAYEYTLRPIQRRLDRIGEAADPTPEQREAIRVALIDFVKRTRLRSTPEQRLELARTIYDALDEERRVKLLAAALLTE